MIANSDLKKIIILGSLFLIFESAKGQVEDYIYNNGMNPYSQPNIQMSYDKNKLDFYGSGDVNNDNTITLADATLIRAGGQGTNYRADVDGNGTVNSTDATMIENYKNGTLLRLPSDWNNLDRSERISWLTKMLAIDMTSERTYVVPNYMCGEFSREHQINFFGIQNLESYLHYDLFAQDGNDNAKFNIPVYTVSTKITPGTSSIYTEATGHAINAVLVGPTSGERYAEDPTNFSHWYFFEPQTDGEVVPGNFSMNEDENVTIRWFGYSSNFSAGFNYRDLINFDLNNGQVNAITSIHPWLILTNPNAPDFPTGKEDLNQDACGFNKIYPVPTEDRATFVYSTVVPEEVNFSIINLSGKVVDQFKMESNPGENNFEYSFKERIKVGPGIYYVKLKTLNYISVRTIIIK